MCWCGEIGRRKGLKIPRWQHRTGSSPVTSTRLSLDAFRVRTLFFYISKAARVHSGHIFKPIFTVESLDTQIVPGVFFFFTVRSPRS